MRDGINGHRKCTFRRRARALARDTRGATIIEFAIVAMPFIVLLIAILQTSLVFFAQQLLETTAEDTSRVILTNQAQKAGTSQADFKSAACSTLPSFMNCNDLMIDVRTVNSFSAVDTSMPTLTYDSDGNVTNSWKYELGGADKVVVMRLMYMLPVISGPLGFDLSNMRNGHRLLIATAVFQPEPLS